MVGVVSAIVLVVVGVDVWATSQVARNEPDPRGRRLQLALVWGLPIIGAVLAGLAHAKRRPPLANPTDWPNTNEGDARFYQPNHPPGGDHST